MAATFTNIQANFKHRYGAWIDPLPDDHTLAEYGKFVQQDERPGFDLSFPVLTGIEHGQTANVDNSAFPINAAIDSQISLATLDGATILMQTVLSYDTIYKGLNGAGNGNSGGAFKTALDQAVEAMLMGHALYRELSLAYGCGGAAATAIASDIGVVASSVSGANLAAPQVVKITPATWIPGLWIMMQNAKLDIYQTNGTTLRDNGVTMQGMPGGQAVANLQLFKTASAATVAAGDRLIPAGWLGKSCYGLEAIYNNAGTLFGINAATIAPWRCMTFATTGQLTRAKIMAQGAKLALTGVKNGGKLFCSAQTFADLAEEANALRRWTDSSKTRSQGASELVYTTACGDITVAVYQYAKQSQAMFVQSEGFKRVGSTDITMRPIGGGAQGFFTHSTTTAGAQIKSFYNGAPVFEKPYQNLLIMGIQNSGDVS